MLSALFYIAVMLCLAVEIQDITDTGRVIRASKAIKEKLESDELETLTGFDRGYMVSSIFYYLVVLVGLFSSQWLLFTGLIFMGILGTIYRNDEIARKVGSSISCLLILFIIINKYHLHLDLVESIRKLFV